MKVNGKKLFVAVSAEIIVSVIIAAAIGLGLLFGGIPSTEIVGKIMLTLLTMFIAGLLLLNSISAVKVGNKLGIFSAFMLILSSILFYILIWAGDLLGDFYTVFSYIIVIVSMLSIFLDILVGNYIKLGTSLIAVQIVFYIAFIYIELVISFAILGNSTLIELWQIFVTAIIVAFTLYIVLKVRQKNIAAKSAEKPLNGDEYITITRTEYENLKALAERNGGGEQITVAPLGVPNGLNGSNVSVGANGANVINGAGVMGSVGAGVAGGIGATIDGEQENIKEKE